MSPTPSAAMPPEDAIPALRFAETAAPRTPAVSVVIPVFNEAAGLPQLHARLRDVLDALEASSEVV